MSDTLLFLRRLIAQPTHIGAIAPSGRRLAQAIAAEADPQKPGPVLELGPGTGAVTAALIARGFAPGRIVAIEYDADLAQRVAHRFPGVRVINGDAFDLARTLGDHAEARFAAVVSSLPLLNFPQAQRDRLMEQVFSRLAPGAPFIQFSYGMNPPVQPPFGATVTRAALILRNLPPARVWVYRPV
jgi:phosphatidylethanolamine/phosphatidyl-N-methylethanolamine N-methyltransferase